MNESRHGLARAALLALAATTLLASHVRADGDYYFSPTDERVRLSLGAMHVSSSTMVRADSSTGVTGTTLDGERDFGLEKTDFEPKFEATVRVATRHRLTFDYFTLDRSGNATVGAAPVIFRDVLLIPGDPAANPVESANARDHLRVFVLAQ